MKLRSLALTLVLLCGPAVATVAAKNKQAAPVVKAPKVKAPKVKKPKNAVNTRSLKKFQKSHGLPMHKAAKAPKMPKHPAALHPKPPKPTKHRA